MLLVKKWRECLVPLLAGLVFMGAAQAASQELLLGVNEGTSGALSYTDMQEKYKPLACYLSTQLKRPVTLESARNLDSLNYNLDKKRYDLVLIRPSQIAARAMRDDGYKLLTAAQGEAITYFIVPGNSPLKTAADLKGKAIAFPDDQAYPTRVALAMLRDQGIKPNQVKLQYFKTQEVVGYSVENKFNDAGVVVSYSKVAKDWTKQGGRILWKSRSLPFWSVSASSQLDDATQATVKSALLALSNNAQGQEILKKAGVSGFVPADPAAYLTLLKWTGD